jgi:glycosyltransferase involved in cell wall biosynthesis
VDEFAANSNYIRDRIRKTWRREAEVIHPPVDTSLFTPSIEIDDAYLWVGQMVPYKRPDLAVEAFNISGKPLVMVGTGSMAKKLRAMAGPNISFVERLDFNSLKRAYSRAKAFIMTAEEDFGITPVETMASGRPVVAFGKGGALDTVLHERTGIFFDRQDVDSLNEAIVKLEQFLPHFDSRDAVRQAERFNPEIFDRKILALAGQ